LGNGRLAALGSCLQAIQRNPQQEKPMSLNFFFAKWHRNQARRKVTNQKAPKKGTKKLSPKRGTFYLSPKKVSRNIGPIKCCLLPIALYLFIASASLPGRQAVRFRKWGWCHAGYGEYRF